MPEVLAGTLKAVIAAVIVIITVVVFDIAVLWMDRTLNTVSEAAAGALGVGVGEVRDRRAADHALGLVQASAPIVPAAILAILVIHYLHTKQR